MQILAYDSETFLIAAGAVYPKLVCGTFAWWDGLNEQVLRDGRDRDALRPMFEQWIDNDDLVLVGLNMQFDMIVAACVWPDLIPKILRKYRKGLIHDIRLIEKLIHLSSHGRVDKIKVAGKETKLGYRLMDLEKRYLGIDRSNQKEGNDIWRLRYSELDGVPWAQYPDDAREYALDDAGSTLMVYYAQLQRLQNEPHLSAKTHEWQAFKHFCLGLSTAWGMVTDQDEVQKVKALLQVELAPEKHPLLFEFGIRRRAQPARPYANGAIDKATGEPKMTQPKGESTNKKQLLSRVAEVARLNGYEWIDHKQFARGKQLNYTETGCVSSNKLVLEELAPLDPVLEQFQHHQSLQKLATNDVPKLDGNAVIHPNYDPLKETGRTSSFGGDLYPSINIQQMPKKLGDVEIRRCFVARPGTLICASDYTSLELVSWAQACLTLGLPSRMAAILNEGVDPHAFLGAQIALETSPEFNQLWRSNSPEAESIGGVPAEMFSAYEFFKQQPKEFYGYYRTLAKPVGLGFPGGLGAKTLVKGPARQYGLRLDEEVGKRLRQIWLRTFPEAKPYFALVDKRLVDPMNSQGWEENGDGELVAEDKAYQYVTPMGMVRRGATYCAAANGLGLQSPSAEGATIHALTNLTDACWIPDQSILYGCRILAFIHDEFLVEIPDDELAHERAMEISRIMVDSMKTIMKDVRVEAEPVLMRRWLKGAKPVFINDRLQVFEEAA